MERCSTDLESESNQKHTERDERQRLHAVAGKGSGEVGELKRTRPQVEQGKAVKANTGGHRTDDEVLHTGLRAFFAFLHEGNKHVGGERSQFQSNEQQEEVLSEGDDRHAQPGGEQEHVEVNLTSVVVEARSAAVRSARGGYTVDGRSTGKSERTEENELKHAAELVDLQHHVVARNDLRFLHPVDKGHRCQAKGDGEEHRCEEAGQAGVAVEGTALSTHEPWDANLCQRNAEFGIAEVGHDHEGEQPDDENEFRGKGEHEAFTKGLNLIHIRHLPSKLESRASQRTPRSNRSSCQGQSTASRQRGW